MTIKLTTVLKLFLAVLSLFIFDAVVLPSSAPKAVSSTNNVLPTASQCLAVEHIVTPEGFCIPKSRPGCKPRSYHVGRLNACIEVEIITDEDCKASSACMADNVLYWRHRNDQPATDVSTVAEPVVAEVGGK